MTLHAPHSRRRPPTDSANPATAPPDAFDLRKVLSSLDQHYLVDTELVAKVMGVDVNRIIDLALGEDPTDDELAIFAPRLTRLLDTAARLEKHHPTRHALNLALWPMIGEFQTGIMPKISPAAFRTASFGGNPAQEQKSA